MRIAVLTGWAITSAAMAAMVIGHLGSHDLNWRTDQISTYAATAPFDGLVTLSMLLSAGALVVAGLLASRYGLFGNGIWNHAIPLLAGAAAVGLIMLAHYEETARTLAALRQSGFGAIRQQSFHDAGLQIFFYSGVLLVTVMGVLTMALGVSLAERLVGILMFGLGPGSFLLMTTAWTRAIGIEAPATGLQQRASLLCLWLAMVCVLVIATGRSFQRFDNGRA